MSNLLNNSNCNQIKLEFMLGTSLDSIILEMYSKILIFPDGEHKNLISSLARIKSRLEDIEANCIRCPYCGTASEYNYMTFQKEPTYYCTKPDDFLFN